MTRHLHRLTVVGLLTATLLACTGPAPTAAPLVMPAPSAPMTAPRAQQVMAPLTSTTVPTGVVMVSTPTYLTGSKHAAFPDLEPMAGGGLELVYREGSDHYLARDGQLLSTTLDATGQNPSPPTTLLGGAGVDYRDPSLTVIDGHRYLTWFTGSATNPAEGAMLTIDNGAPIRIDPGYPYAAIAAPAVKLPDGRLGAAYYGRKPGETKDTAFMAWSADQGQTWTSNRILAPGGTTATPEPWIVVDGQKTLFFARWGPDRLAVRVSMDSGTTWGQPYLISQNAGMTGRPTVHLTQSGVQVMVYREHGTKSARLAYSLDHGGTWTIGQTVLPAPAGSPLGMTYAAMADIPGTVPLIRLIVGMEQTDGSSALYGTYLAVSHQ
jgi:hypothetical protein